MNLETTDTIEKKDGWERVDSPSGTTAVTDTTSSLPSSSMSYQAKQKPGNRDASKRTRWKYGVAPVSILMALLVRWSVDVYLQDSLPFATFLIAVLITTWYGGIGVSLITIVFGGVLSNWFFVQPRYQLSMLGLIDQAGMVIYLTVSFTTVGFIQTWKWAWRKTDRMTRELQDQVTTIHLTEDK